MTNRSLPDTVRRTREAFAADADPPASRVMGYSDLDGLPIGTVVRTGPASTWERLRLGRLGWWSTGGAHDDFPAIDNRTVQVLYLPGEEQGPIGAHRAPNSLPASVRERARAALVQALTHEQTFATINSEAREYVDTVINAFAAAGLLATAGTEGEAEAIGAVDAALRGES